jgi:hypothetical protein
MLLAAQPVLAGVRPGSGDADCSGRADSLDALLVLQAEAELLSILDLPCLDAANVYIDPSIDANDAAAILRYEAGLLASLPPVPDAILDVVYDATADRGGIPAEQVVFVEAETAGWGSSCLGLQEPGELCLAVITFGWRITLRAGDHTAIWRITNTGWYRLESLT